MPTFCPITIGKKTLPINVFYAPLAGCSDFCFRKMTARYRPGLMFCEMVKMDALVRYDPNTFSLLDYSEDMHPIGAQLCGSKVHYAKKAAQIIEDLGFDVIDLNCGCPVDKVTKDGSGSGLLKNPDLIGEIVSQIVASCSIPVTIKIRAGWDEDALVFSEICKIAEQAGASAITLHGRTREQGYKGPANWNWITECKKSAKNIKVIGNGDLFSAEDAFSMMEKTGCDGVLVSRGTLGQPWIVESIRKLANGNASYAPSFQELKNALLEHFEFVMSYLPERKALLEMRKVGCWYIKSSKGTRSFREAVSRCQDIRTMRALIQNYTEDEPISSDESP